MSEKDKKKIKEKTEQNAETKPKVDKASEPKLDKANLEKTQKPVSVKAEKPSRRLINRRTGLLGRRTRHIQKLNLEMLAKRTETAPIVLAALKAAYNWTDKTTLTKAEFIHLRDAWLKSPAKQGGRKDKS